MKLSSVIVSLLTARFANAAPQWGSGPGYGQSPAADRSEFSWGSTKIYGVNIGGWLVLEPWITPSIFEGVDQSLNIVDEYTLCERLPNDAPGILKEHWESWVGPGDLQKIASAGFNVIRIPVGYWAFDNSNSPYVSGADEYLERAIGWAQGTSPPLKVLIDLHGAPGSQNGYDNSGQLLETPGWMKDGGASGFTGQKTLSVLETIAEKYADPQYDEVVIGIELVNEPQNWSVNMDDLRQFYREGYGRIRDVSDNTVVVLSDAFANTSSWNWFLGPNDNDAQRVAMDHHYYQVFTPEEISLSVDGHIDHVCKTANTYWGSDKWTIVGEWTGAMSDCAKYLNGYKKGTRWEGTLQVSWAPDFKGVAPVGSCAARNDMNQWDDQMKSETRQFIEAQMDAFLANTVGFFWWNFKTEGTAAEWDLFALLDAGVFPQPIVDRQYPAACTQYS